MPLFLGNPDYSPVKGYAELSGDFAQAAADIYLSEGKFVKTLGNYYLLGVADSISGLWKPSEFKKGSQVCVVFHTQEYERWISKDKPKELTQPTAIEKLIAKWLEADGSQWLADHFSGKITLNGNESFIEAIEQNNLWTLLAKITRCQPSLIKGFEIKTKKNAGSTTVKESDKLSERHAFIVETCKVFNEKGDDLIGVVVGLQEYKEANPEGFEIFINLLNLMLK